MCQIQTIIPDNKMYLGLDQQIPLPPNPQYISNAFGIQEECKKIHVSNSNQQPFLNQYLWNHSLWVPQNIDLEFPPLSPSEIGQNCLCKTFWTSNCLQDEIQFYILRREWERNLICEKEWKFSNVVSLFWVQMNAFLKLLLADVEKKKKYLICLWWLSKYLANIHLGQESNQTKLTLTIYILSKAILTLWKHFWIVCNFCLNSFCFKL